MEINDQEIIKDLHCICKISYMDAENLCKPGEIKRFAEIFSELFDEKFKELKEYVIDLAIAKFEYQSERELREIERKRGI